jgi:hypothetical protein
MNEVRVEHALPLEVARERFAELARRNGVAVVSADGLRGTLERALPFVGKLRGEFEVGGREVVVRVLEAPAFPSAETVRRMVADELRKVLGAPSA